MSYDLTKVRKDESEGWTNMLGPGANFSFEGTYEMTDEDSVRFGASFYARIPAAKRPKPRHHLV